MWGLAELILQIAVNEMFYFVNFQQACVTKDRSAVFKCELALRALK